MVGPPGAGKGTQSHAVARKFGIPEISTGHMLRDAVQMKTPAGLQAQAAMESGKLVPDGLVCQLIEQRILEPDSAQGFVIDGFPRNVNQAVFLERLLESRRWGHTMVLNLRVDRETVLKRLSGRRICPVCGTTYNIFYSPPRREGFCDREGSPLTQRPDDNEEVIGRRLREYECQTEPLIGYYRGLNLLKDIDGNRDSAEVTAAIFGTLNAS